MIIKQRNMQSEPVRHGRFNSTIGHTINPYPGYKPEKRHLSKKKKTVERRKWNQHYNEKMNGPFKSMAHPRDSINTSRQVFGGDPEKILPVKKVID